MGKVKSLGIMNGTSLDAIDYTLIDVDTQSWKPVYLKHKQKNIPIKLRKQLLAAANNQLTVHELSYLNFELGRLYAKHIKELHRTWKWKVIGLHGQTVHHHGRTATLQIGHPALIKTVWDGPIVSDFRSLDIAFNGEGAPFAPFLQKFLTIGSNKDPIAFHNLGGISNLTYFHKKQILAFDTGPANILLDLWIKKKSKNKRNFDLNGQEAAKGLYHNSTLQRMLNHKFFKRVPPKSCGREEFNQDFITQFTDRKFKALSFNDQMATICELSAISIAQAYKHQCPKLPKKIFFYGGGVHNKYMMSRIAFHLSTCEIKTTLDLGWPTQALEAGIFAFLAVARAQNKKLHLPQVTGAKKTLCLGQLYY